MLSSSRRLDFYFSSVSPKSQIGVDMAARLGHLLGIKTNIGSTSNHLLIGPGPNFQPKARGLNFLFYSWTEWGRQVLKGAINHGGR